MKWWEISRPCNLHTNSPLMPPGGLLLVETVEEWRAVWSTSSQPVLLFFSGWAAQAAQLVSIQPSVSSWQASLRAWAGLSRMKTMKGILKAFYLFALSSHTRSGEADSAGIPPLPFSLALPPHSPRCYNQGSSWNEAQGRWDWDTWYPAAAITALITMIL